MIPFPIRTLLCIAALAMVPTAQAALQPDGSGYRTGVSDLALQIRYLPSVDAEFTGGSKISTDEDLGISFWFGHNLDEHWEIEGGFDWSTVNYEATIASADVIPGPDVVVAGTMESFTLYGAGTYNFMVGPITPFVTAGLGWSLIDSNIPAGPPTSTCWWDPWWGYVCGTWQPTKSTSDWSIRYGVGVRWQLNRNYFLRFSIQEMQMPFGDNGSSPTALAYKIDWGGSM